MKKILYIIFLALFSFSTIQIYKAYQIYNANRYIKSSNVSNNTKLENSFFVQTVNYSSNILYSKITNAFALPFKNLNLSKINSIKINALGVEAELIEGKDSVVALQKGPWIADDFSTPPSKYLKTTKKPIIISSHLYGSPSWSKEFRDKVSFAGLENLQNGEEIKINWNQREYKFKIVDSSKGSKIKSYNYDLILYTCTDLFGSDIRDIKYANFVIN